jgi:hypothetical protein
MTTGLLGKKPEPGPTLDALVAEHVLDWPVSSEMFPRAVPFVFVNGDDRHAYENYAEMWLGSSKYSGDGWIVASELGANGYLVAMYQDFDGTWLVSTDFGDAIYSERSDNPMYALCLAALKTVGFTWPEDEDDV